MGDFSGHRPAVCALTVVQEIGGFESLLGKRKKGKQRLFYANKSTRTVSLRFWSLLRAERWVPARFGSG